VYESFSTKNLKIKKGVKQVLDPTALITIEEVQAAIHRLKKNIKLRALVMIIAATPARRS